jgi:hypothetical protein
VAHIQGVCKDKFFVRRILMKKKASWSVLIGLMTALTLALCLGCDNGDETGEDTSIEVPVANVQVYNADGAVYTGDGAVKIRYNSDADGDAGTITGGKLSLSLPAAVEDQYLQPFEGLSEDITVSPDDAKVFIVEDFNLIKDEKSVGDLFYEKYVEDVSSDSILYIYSSTAVTVTGTAKEEDDEIEYTQTYNLNLKKGWNTVYAHYEESDTTASSTHTTDGSAIPSGLKWVLYSR